MINEESKGTFKDRDTSRERDRADKRIKDRKIGMKEISGQSYKHLNNIIYVLRVINAD